MLQKVPIVGVFPFRHHPLRFGGEGFGTFPQDDFQRFHPADALELFIVLTGKRDLFLLRQPLPGLKMELVGGNDHPVEIENHPTNHGAAEADARTERDRGNSRF